MKRIIFTILLLIAVSNISFARERIKNDPEAHVKPTYSTEIESVEIVPTIVHLSETEEIVMETAPTTTEASTETEEETTTEETQIVVPEVEQAFIDDKKYTKNDLPSVGYSRKDTDEPTNAQVETIQEAVDLFARIPLSLGVRITYRSDVNGWAEFHITYKTTKGEFTNTVIKPISKGLNILTYSSRSSENVTYFQTPNMYCTKIDRIVLG